MKYECENFGRPGKEKHLEDYGYCNSNLGIFIVADGLSDSPRASLAATGAVLVGRKSLRHSVSKNDERPIEWVCDAMKDAGECVYDMNTAKDDLGNTRVKKLARTTLSIALIHNHSLYWASIGDSRIYALGNDGGLNQLTTDDVSKEGGLTRCLGKSDMFEFGSGQLDLSGFKMLYLATDGVYKRIADSEVEEILNANCPLEEKIKQLESCAHHPVMAAHALAAQKGISFDEAKDSLMSYDDDKTAIIVSWRED